MIQSAKVQQPSAIVILLTGSLKFSNCDRTHLHIFLNSSIEILLNHTYAFLVPDSQILQRLAKLYGFLLVPMLVGWDIHSDDSKVTEQFAASKMCNILLDSKSSTEPAALHYFAGLSFIYIAASWHCCCLPPVDMTVYAIIFSSRADPPSLWHLSSDIHVAKISIEFSTYM